MRRILLTCLLIATQTALSAPWCGYQQNPAQDRHQALEQSWQACGQPTLPGPYGTPEFREHYAQEKGDAYMSLAAFFNNALKTCFYAARDGATSDQVDTCDTSYRLLQDEQGPAPQSSTGYAPYLENR